MKDKGIEKKKAVFDVVVTACSSSLVNFDSLPPTLRLVLDFFMTVYFI